MTINITPGSATGVPADDGCTFSEGALAFGVDPGIVPGCAECGLLAGGDGGEVGADTRLPDHVEEGQEWWLIPVGESVHGPLRELVWPDPSQPGHARFTLRESMEDVLWHRISLAEKSSLSEFALAEAEMERAQERVRVTHRVMSGEFLGLARRLE